MERGYVYIETLYEGRGLPLCLEASREKKHNSLRVLWFPPSQEQSAAGAEAGISISVAGEDKDTAVPQSSHSLFVLKLVHWYICGCTGM